MVNWDHERDEELGWHARMLAEQGLLESLPSNAQFVRYIAPHERVLVYTRFLIGQGFELHALDSDDVSH